MLKLKRVELQGFKSFCDRTEMRFNGAGITAIVGPNGCGKSNLSDAISWVLGEQSAKSLRGVRMQDVIFAGTNSRKPVGLASVSMTLVDESYHAPDPAASNGNGHGSNGGGIAKLREVTVTRRLFRSGESDYLIDGKHVRLRDIQDLFMGTGLGPESYAIIEQGRIGQILSSRPQDRRNVIEEAAGISKFKARRRLAEAKLEGARQNLSRVFDILEEVSRQANSLKRQANKAERYKKLQAQMIVELRRALTGRYRMVEREAAKIALDLNAAGAEFQKLAGEVSAKEKQQSEAQQRAYQLETELRETRSRLGELRLEAERTRGRLNSQASQIANIEPRLAQGETEAQALEGRAAEMEKQLAAHAGTLAELEQQTEQARAALAAKAKQKESALARFREREQAIEAARQSVLRLLGETSQLKNELARVDAFVATMERDSARARHEQQEAAADEERLCGSRKELSGKLSTRQGELDKIISRRKKVGEDLAVRKARLGEARTELERLRAGTSKLKARRDSLDEILSHRAYTTESVKNLFTAIARGRAPGLEPLGVLADFVDVDADYEKAAEEFLHDELEYVVVKDWHQAEHGIKLMGRELGGRATFLIHPEPGASSPAPLVEPPLGPETGIVTRLSNVLRLTNGLSHAPAELVPRIARCLIVADHASAQRLAERYPDFYFLVADGVCYHGYAVSGGKTTSGGPLALKRELRELTALVRSRQRERDKAAELVSALEAEITSLGEQFERLRGEQASSEREVLAIGHEVQKLEEEHTRATHRRAVAQGELDRLGRERERSLTQRQQFQAQIEQSERARRSLDEELDQMRATLDDLQVLVARFSEEHSALRVQLAECEERRRSENNTRVQLEAQQRELTARRGEITAEMERLGVERARLLANNIELDARATELNKELTAGEESVAALETGEAKLRQELAARQEVLKQHRLEAQQAQEKRSRTEVALAEKRAELRYLDETARKELNASPAQLAEGEEEVLEEQELAAAEEKYNQLKTRIASLGPVNPQALEEYEEARQRYEFLNAQRQDLLDSIRDTEKAIHEIDIETRKRFSAAFEVVNENFRHMFKVLFGGGSGEMRLTDPENLSDSGIDVVASPPGKRLQNVLLLSGGEKALTALAMLMAIFQYQPSPFCVLDEVDAPLDETNIQRLVRLIREMSHQTQFIVITHAKSTMEVSESLYGVTMQEPGVSRLVSVKFYPLPATLPEGQQRPRAVPV